MKTEANYWFLVEKYLQNYINLTAPIYYLQIPGKKLSSS